MDFYGWSTHETHCLLSIWACQYDGNWMVQINLLLAASVRLNTSNLVFASRNDVCFYLHIERVSEIRSLLVTQDTWTLSYPLENGLHNMHVHARCKQGLHSFWGI